MPVEKFKLQFYFGYDENSNSEFLTPIPKCPSSKPGTVFSILNFLQNFIMCLIS